MLPHIPRWVFPILFSSVALPAQTILPTGYTFTVSPSAPYPDSGNELTDANPGLSFSHYNDAPDAIPWVGWQNAAPTVAFQFSADQTFSRIEIGTTRHNGASVGLPTSVTTTSLTFNFGADDFADNFRGWLVLDGAFSTTLVGGIPTLTMDFGGAHAQWLMLDEIRFTAVPEPAHFASVLSAILLGGAVALRRHRAKPPTTN